MRKYFKFYISCLIVLTSCSGNVLRDIASVENSETLFTEARKLMDASLFDEAYDKLVLIESQDTDFAETNRFKKTKAGVQAGQCGMTFITFIDGLSSASGGNVFKILMQAFSQRAVDPQKCADAQTTIESLSSADDDQLLFLAVLGMAKVGTGLRDKADRDGADSLGDGTADGGFDVCSTTTADNRLDDTDMKHIITGLGLTLKNFALIGGSFSGSTTEGTLNSLQDFCDDPAGDGTGAGKDADKIECQITDVDSAALTPQLVRVFRRLLKMSDQGLGTATPSCTLNPLDAAYCCPGLATP